MTVSTTLDRQYFNGNSVTVAFPFNFRFLANSQIYVTLIDAAGVGTLQTLGVNYSLAGVNLAGGGTVTMFVAPPTGYRLLVQRILPATQETSIRNQGRFFPEIHENVFDTLTMLIQQAISGLTNALQKTVSGLSWDFLGLRGINVGTPVSPNDASTKAYTDGVGQAAQNYADTLNAKTVRAPENIGLLPPAATRANKFMAFDALGNPAVAAIAGGPVTDAASVLWTRTPLASAILTVHQMLDSNPVSVWEFAGLITSMPNPSDPSTWDWTPAFQYAISNYSDVVAPPGTYVIDTLQLHGYMKFVGYGVRLKDKAGSSAIGMFTIPPGPTIKLTMMGVRLDGDPSNTTKHGFYFESRVGVSPVTTDGGLWWSTFKDIMISEFSGHGAYLLGGPGLGPSAFLLPHQFLTFENCQFLSGSGAFNPLRLKGQVGQCTFTQCRYDNKLGTTKPNQSKGILCDVFSVSDDSSPYTITFDTCTIQNCSGVQVNRSRKVIFRNPYSENCADGFLFASSGIQHAVYDSDFRNVFRGDGTAALIKADGTSEVYVQNVRHGGIVEHGLVGGQTTGSVMILNGFCSAPIEGCTRQLNAAATGIINAGGSPTVAVSASASVSTVTSNQVVGSCLVVRPLSVITFVPGGNITFPTGVPSITVPIGVPVVFFRIDLGGTWLMITGGTYDTLVSKIAGTPSAAYVQAEMQVVYDRINSIVDGLRAIGAFRTT